MTTPTFPHEMIIGYTRDNYSELNELMLKNADLRDYMTSYKGCRAAIMDKLQRYGQIDCNFEKTGIIFNTDDHEKLLKIVNWLTRDDLDVLVLAPILYAICGNDVTVEYLRSKVVSTRVHDRLVEALEIEEY